MADWTLDWLRERIRHGHHRVLSKYLVQRTPDLAREHGGAGYTADHIVREAFHVRNGATAVPEDAMKVLRNCPDLDARIVKEIVFKTPDRRQRALFERCLLKLLPKRPALRELYEEVYGLNSVSDVLES